MPCVAPRFSIEFYAANEAAKKSDLSILCVKYDAMVVGRQTIAETYQTVPSRPRRPHADPEPSQSDN